jgi:hypothetical protein
MVTKLAAYPSFLNNPSSLVCKDLTSFSASCMQKSNQFGYLKILNIIKINLSNNISLKFIEFWEESAFIAKVKRLSQVFVSVPNPGSGVFLTPGSRISGIGFFRISDPGSQTLIFLS